MNGDSCELPWENGDWISELEAVAAHTGCIAYSNATKLVSTRHGIAC